MVWTLNFPGVVLSIIIFICILYIMYLYLCPCLGLILFMSHLCYLFFFISIFIIINTVKPLNSGHYRFLKKLSVIERCPLLGGNFKKIVTFAAQRFVRYSRHVRYLACLLLGGFPVHVSTKSTHSNLRKIKSGINENICHIK